MGDKTLQERVMELELVVRRIESEMRELRLRPFPRLDMSVPEIPVKRGPGRPRLVQEDL